MSLPPTTRRAFLRAPATIGLLQQLLLLALDDLRGPDPVSSVFLLHRARRALDALLKALPRP